MIVLFVVAHPDDEVLGGGGYIHMLKRNPNNRVSVCCLMQRDTTRYIGVDDGLANDLDKSHQILGIDQLYLGDFADSDFNNQSHRKMVEFIESAIASEHPNVIITQHPSDINMDHYFTSVAAQEAMRYPQRGRYDCPPIDGFYYMEVQSSTDWYLNTSLMPFVPNTFQKIDRPALDAKLQALEIYENVIRPQPHPRSKLSICSLATYRGTQGGYHMAEAFQCVFRRGI